MALNTAQRKHFHKRVMEEMDRFYGDKVPTLKRFKEQRKATYLKQLKEEIEYEKYVEEIISSEQTERALAKESERLEEDRREDMEELRETHRRQMDDLKEKQDREMEDLVKRWEPELDSANRLLVDAQKRIKHIKRVYYFKALGIEDDGRSFSYRAPNVDGALGRRVGDYMKYRLKDDPLGTKVFERIEEEKVATDIVHAANGTKQLKGMLEEAAARGLIPQIEITGLQLLD